ncbi:hypothetical protein D3C73_1292740 [compost metagenome]
MIPRSYLNVRKLSSGGKFSQSGRWRSGQKKVYSPRLTHLGSSIYEHWVIMIRKRVNFVDDHQIEGVPKPHQLMRRSDRNHPLLPALLTPTVQRNYRRIRKCLAYTGHQLQHNISSRCCHSHLAAPRQCIRDHGKNHFRLPSTSYSPYQKFARLFLLCR